MNELTPLVSRLKLPTKSFAVSMSVYLGRSRAVTCCCVPLRRSSRGRVVVERRNFMVQVW